MQATSLEEHIARAKADSDYYARLVSDPASIIDDFDAIEHRVTQAIDAMTPQVAQRDLLAAPSNDHCFRTSCGLSSFIEQ